MGMFLIGFLAGVVATLMVGKIIHDRSEDDD